MSATSNYYNHSKTDTQNLKPGYQNVAWIAPASWFTAVAEPVAGGLGEDRLTITTDHTFPAGKGFIKCYLQPRKNTVTAESKGDPGAQTLNWKLSVVIPGDSAKLQAMIEELMNDDLIILQKDANCPGNAVTQYGCDCNPGSMSAVKFDGSKVGDANVKAWSFDVETNCRFFYEGTITVMP